MTPAGIETATFRFVAQCLSQLRQQVDPPHLTADSKCILHEGYLKCFKNTEIEQEVSERVIFFSTCILKGFEAPKTSPSTLSPDDGDSSGFRTTLFLEKLCDGEISKHM